MRRAGADHERSRGGRGFLNSLNGVALIRACSSDSVYVARNRAIKVSSFLNTQWERVTKDALLDSGATECFIHPRLVERLSLERHKLAKSRTVKNVDNSPNRLGAVMHMVNIRVNYNNCTNIHRFLIADIGEDDLILGYPFLEAADPLIDWTKGMIEGLITMKGTAKPQDDRIA